MTIPEQLHLDVLSAPLAQMDRRTLSQAWYSALFSAPAAPVPPPQPLKRRPEPPPRSQTPAKGAGEPFRTARPALTRPAAGEPGATLPSPGERRAQSSPLARRIERALLRPGVRVRSATFTAAKGGRVHVVLQHCGPNIRLVALRARSAHAAVAQALMQARFALAQRGVRLETKLLEDAR